MAGHAQLKFVMTECSKTQIRLTGLNYYCNDTNMCDRYSYILPDSNLKSHKKKQKKQKHFVCWISLYKKWRQLAKSNVKDVISANNVDVEKA